MLRSTLAMLAAGVVVSTAAGAQTYSFESPTVAGYAYDPTNFAGITFTGGAGVAVVGSPFFSATPPDGSQAAFIQNEGTISLALTGLSAGTAYTTSFYAVLRPGYPVNPLTVSFNSTVLGTFTATSSAAFSLFTVPDFLASNSTGTLTFSGAPAVDSDVAFDLVTVKASQAVVSGAVPEPATWAMMVVGFGAIGFAVRRRREVSTAVRLA